jgi:hypothetical protein
MLTSAGQLSIGGKMPNQALLAKYLKEMELHKKNTGQAVETITFESLDTFAAFLEISVFEAHAIYGDPPYEIDVREYDAETEN